MSLNRAQRRLQNKQRPRCPTCKSRGAPLMHPVDMERDRYGPKVEWGAYCASCGTLLRDGLYERRAPVGEHP